MESIDLVAYYIYSDTLEKTKRIKYVNRVMIKP